MLVIVNPYATTVSDRLRNLVVYALQARYEVEAVDTERREHATQICREAASEGYDVVVAFGGDGTVNEAANGLVGSDTPLTCLPGRLDQRLVPHARHPQRRRRRHRAPAAAGRRLPARAAWTWAARASRHFVFSAGVGPGRQRRRARGRHPRLKARLGEYYYTYAAVSTFNRRYLVRPPHVRVEAQGRALEGVTVIVQNSDPYTYFGRRPIRISEGTGARDRHARLAVLTRATVLELPTVIAARVLRQGRHRGRATAGSRPFGT